MTDAEKNRRGRQKVNISEPGSLGRRGFLGVVGGVAFAAPLIAACGGSSSSGSSTSAAGSSAASASSGASQAAATGKVTLAQVKTLLGLDGMTPKELGASYSVTLPAQLALTGTISFYGDVMTKGMNLAQKHIKAMGGPDITLSFQDNKGGDPQTSISNVRQLIASGYQFMASSIGASLGSILPEVAAANIVCINTGSGAAVPPYLGAKHYFETDGNLNLQNPFLGQFLEKNYPGKSKLFLVSADACPAQDAAGLKLIEENLVGGWKIVNSQFAPLGSSDFSGIASMIVAANPDAIVSGLASGANGEFLKAYKQTGGNAPFIITGAPPTTADFAAARRQRVRPAPSSSGRFSM